MERKTPRSLCFFGGFEDIYGHQCFESSGAALAAVSAVAISALQSSAELLEPKTPLEGAVRRSEMSGHDALAASLPCHKQVCLNVGPWVGCWYASGLFYLLVEICSTFLSLNTNFLGFL